MALQSTLSGIAVYRVIVVLMALNGILYILLALPDIRKPFFMPTAIAFPAVNTVLTVTDQPGFFDYLVLAWNSVLLVLVFTIVYPRKKA